MEEEKKSLEELENELILAENDDSVKTNLIYSYLKTAASFLEIESTTINSSNEREFASANAAYLEDLAVMLLLDYTIKHETNRDTILREIKPVINGRSVLEITQRIYGIKAYYGSDLFLNDFKADKLEDYIFALEPVSAQKVLERFRENKKKLFGNSKPAIEKQ